MALYLCSETYDLSSPSLRKFLHLLLSFCPCTYLKNKQQQNKNQTNNQPTNNKNQPPPTKNKASNWLCSKTHLPDLQKLFFFPSSLGSFTSSTAWLQPFSFHFLAICLFSTHPQQKHYSAPNLLIFFLLTMTYLILSTVHTSQCFTALPFYPTKVTSQPTPDLAFSQHLFPLLLFSHSNIVLANTPWAGYFLHY